MSKTSHPSKAPKPIPVQKSETTKAVPKVEIKSVVPPNQFKVLGHQQMQKMNISRSGFAIHRPGSRGR
jgi:hypothetical protein